MNANYKNWVPNGMITAMTAGTAILGAGAAALMRVNMNPALKKALEQVVIDSVRTCGSGAAAVASAMPKTKTIRCACFMQYSIPHSGPTERATPVWARPRHAAGARCVTLRGRNASGRDRRRWVGPSPRSAARVRIWRTSRGRADDRGKSPASPCGEAYP